MKIRTAIHMIRETLSGNYPHEEIESFISLVFSYLLGFSGLDLHLKQHEEFPEAKLIQLKEILRRLQNFEPIQYILGETEFYGMKFKVNPSVLIPRPETEELVDWILKDNPVKNASLLDIGTGSGCIPVAIGKNRPDLKIKAMDISEEALCTARENAIWNQVEVQFMELDILKWQEKDFDQKYDVIVSNPPYVTRSEESQMQRNVTEHEPHLALFVPDEEALIFYKAIADFAQEHLVPGGYLYFEINEKMGESLQQLLQQSFSAIIIKKDINGKDRMIRATL
jgi:release factor glutamine methyltransferase